MPRHRVSLKVVWAACLLIVGSSPLATAADVVVRSDEELRSVLRGPLTPGTTVRIEPGTYRGYYGLEGVRGAAGAPITITARDPTRPPRFTESEKSALHLRDCSYVTLSDLVVDSIGDEAIYAVGESAVPFSELSPSNHITIERVAVLNTGKGDWDNHDAIKLTSTDHFAVRGAIIRGWGAGGGAAIDCVGCQHGVIEDSKFFLDRRYDNDIGVSLKGGSRNIVVRNNLFRNAGKDAIEIGQDTGIQWFRQRPGTVLADGTVLDYEAKDIEVLGNRIIGSKSPIFWSKSSGGSVHHNTIVKDQAQDDGGWIMLIANDSNDGLRKAHDGRFHNNLIVYKIAALARGGQPFVMYDPTDPAAATFRFSSNAWFQTDARSEGEHLPRDVGPRGLPVKESDLIYQVDPRLSADWRMESRDPRLRDVGADGFRPASLKAAETMVQRVSRRQPIGPEDIADRRAGGR